MSFLYREVQNCIHDPKCDLKNVEERGIVTPLSFLVVILLMFLLAHTAMCVCYYALLATHQHSQIHLSRDAVHSVRPSTVLFLWGLSSQVQDLVFVLVEFHAPLDGYYLRSTRNLVSSANIVSKHSIILSRSLIKMLSRTSYRIDSCTTWFVTGLQVEYDPSTTTVWT